jgi:hypothetical protein
MDDTLNNQTANFREGNSEASNQLWQYVQSMSPDSVAQMSQPASGEVFQAMERNIVGLLGNLPPEHFGVMITTSREHLGRLLASAMLQGYFLRSAEQRMAFEKSLQVGAMATDPE